MIIRPGYGQLEDHVIRLFEQEGSFVLDGQAYTVKIVGKPRTSAGECKTDVYILGSNPKGTKEIKLSVKTESSNEFQENKIGAERADSIFGLDYKQIITDAASSIASRFTENPLVTVPSYGRTPANSFRMGWKLELASKPRTLSAPLQLSDQEVREYIYKGSNLPRDKKDANVNGQIIRDSGVAEYIIYTEIEHLRSTADVIERMQHIDTAGIKPTYLIFTSNNYRTDVEFDPSKRATASTDGRRPLAIWIDWRVYDGKIQYELVCDPFEKTGYDVKLQLQQELEKIGKRTPFELTQADFHDPSIFNG